jgi:hypothetical protein
VDRYDVPAEMFRMKPIGAFRMTFNEDNLIAAVALAKRAGMNHATLWRYYRAGKLPAVRIFDRVFFRRRPAEKWLASIGKS